jgi:hypothetical protein
MPRQKRHVVFGKGELTRSILDELRGATGPMDSREIAQSIVGVSDQDARDRNADNGRDAARASKALRILKEGGDVRSAVDPKGNLMWSLRALAR